VGGGTENGKKEAKAEEKGARRKAKTAGLLCRRIRLLSGKKGGKTKGGVKKAHGGASRKAQRRVEKKVSTKREWTGRWTQVVWKLSNR